MPHMSQQKRRSRSTGWGSHVKSSTTHPEDSLSSLRGKKSGDSSKFVTEQDVTLKAFADNKSSILGSKTSKAAASTVIREIKQTDTASSILILLTPHVKDVTEDKNQEKIELRAKCKRHYKNISMRDYWHTQEKKKSCEQVVVENWYDRFDSDDKDDVFA